MSLWRNFKRAKYLTGKMAKTLSELITSIMCFGESLFLHLDISIISGKGSQVLTTYTYAYIDICCLFVFPSLLFEIGDM